jgi:hypothetical protein
MRKISKCAVKHKAVSRRADRQAKARPPIPSEGNRFSAFFFYGTIRFTVRQMPPLFLLLGSKECVKLFNQLVRIGAVNRASVLNGFAAGVGATEAVHSDLKEELSGLDVGIKDIADDGFFRNFHL